MLVALRTRTIVVALTAATLLALLIAVGSQHLLPNAFSQQEPGRPAAQQPKPQKRPERIAQAHSAGRPVLPEPAKMVILIRTAMVALNHANMTGNYSVLRDVAAPGFQQANSPERLSELFADLRARDLDLGPVVVLDPKLYREAVIDEGGRLRLTGFFPSRPEQVNFDLSFQRVEGQWRLFGIGVRTSRHATPAAPDSSQAAEQRQPVPPPRPN